jgi:hypothetical protein
MLRDSLEVLGFDEFPAVFARLQPMPSEPGDDGRPLQGEAEARAFVSAWDWALADSDRALDYLEQVGRDPDSVNARVVWFEVLQDPVFDDLRDEPRFERLMVAFGL